LTGFRKENPFKFDYSLLILIYKKLQNFSVYFKPIFPPNFHLSPYGLIFLPYMKEAFFSLLIPFEK